MTFSQKLKAERERLGLTQAEADTKLKLGKGQFAAWESERNAPHEIMQTGVIERLKKLKPARKTK